VLNVKEGDRCAQLVIQPNLDDSWVYSVIDDPNDTTRIDFVDASAQKDTLTDEEPADDLEIDMSGSVLRRELA